MLRATLFLIPVLLAFSGCAEPQPPEFLSKEHTFRVRFGRPPKVTEKSGATRSTVYSVETADGALTVTVRNLPIPDDAPADSVPVYLKSAQADMIHAANGTPTTESAIALAGKHPGREFAARFSQPQPGALRARIYLVGKRLYQVMAIGTDAFVNAPTAGAFLESFMVTSD